MSLARLSHFLIALLAASALWASEHHGMVKFAGLPVPGVTVTATQGDKKLAAVTDPDGVYAFRDLADGVWKIDVEMLCFTPIHEEVAIAPDAPSPTWELKLLPMDQIQAAAPPPSPPAPAPTQTANLNNARPETPAAKPKTARLPKGAPPPSAANPTGGFQRANLNASDNSARPAADSSAPAPDEPSQASSDGLLINGSVNNGAASPFAQSAAFGNNRRGGRSFYNGNAGFQMDNSNLDARWFSQTGQDTPQPSYNHFTGFASFGGPLPLPHVPKLNQPNFVINYQWTRNRNANTQPALMPTELQRSGDFSSQGAPIIDPTTRQPIPGNIIPAGSISPQAQTLLSLYPLPNFNGSSRYNYQVPLVSVLHEDDMQSRFNKTIGRMNQVNGTFAFQDQRLSTPTIFNFDDTSSRLGITSTVNWIHRFSQRMFLTAGMQYSRLNARTTPYFAFRDNVSAIAGIAGNNQDSLNWGPPSLNFSGGIQGLSDAQQSLTRNQTTGYSVDLFWAHSPHNFRMGMDVKRQQTNLLSQQDPRGTFTFTGASTQVTGANGLPVPGTGSDFAGFLLGIPDSVSLAAGNADKYFRDNIWDAYFTDDWRVGPGFTLNAGARWEYGSPITERYGRLVNLDIASGYSAIAPVVAYSPTGPLTGRRYPDSLLNPDRHGFEPRIGFAWHPILASSLVVRGGYGIYYDTSVYTGIATMMAQQSPLSKSFSVSNTPANPFTLANALNATPANSNTFAVDPNFRAGYSQNWQLSVQRDLPGSMVVTATYLGIKGTRARQAFLPNTYPEGADNPCPSCPSGFVDLTSNGNSTRESGQVQLRRRLRAGVTATLNYTFSKAIDDAALGGRGQTGSVIAQNWLDLSAERGLSGFDQRHLVNFQAQYSTGQGLGGGALMSGWRGAIFKDWTVATAITAGTGLPLSPVYPSLIRGTGVTGPLRPDYTGAPLYDAPTGLALNPAAYTAPTGHWGNAGRDSITGPGQFTLNASLARTFRIDDKRSADLRFDANNALNHVTFPSWNTTVGSAQFGLPGTANAMRVLQTTLRVRF